MQAVTVNQLLQLTCKELGSIALKSEPTYQRSLQAKTTVYDQENKLWFYLNEHMPFYTKQIWISHMLNKVFTFGNAFDTSEQYLPKKAVHQVTLIKFSSIIFVQTCLKDMLENCKQINSNVDNNLSLSCFAKTIESIHPVGEFTRILATITPIRFLNTVVNKLPNEFIESDCELIVRNLSQYKDEEISDNLSFIITSIKFQLMQISTQ